MASYSVEVSSTAERQIRKLEHNEQLRVLRAIAALGRDPRPRGSRRLSGFDDVYRIRVGVLRVLYSVENRRLVVIILKVGQRKDVYR